MLLITDSTTDPYWNLAAEEFIADNFREPVFRLWRNSPAVIIGRNQNAAAEMDRDYVREHGIALVRRLTGGGAVFHDLGNVNFTFADEEHGGESAEMMFRRFTSPIIDALRKLGTDARLEGRNDIIIGPPEHCAKVSGNAMCISRGRILQHGTLLFNADLTQLSKALLPRSEKYEGRGVRSVRSRVTNIAEHLPYPMSVEQFTAFLQREAGGAAIARSFTAEERERIGALADTKYRTDLWNWGAQASSPGASALPGDATRTFCRRTEAGLIEATFTVMDGKISGLQISGDYFFKRPTEEFCALLEGCPYDKKAVTALLGTVTVSDWFAGIREDELSESLFLGLNQTVL